MTPTPTRARLVELLATEATQKLTPDERNELAALLRAFPDEDPNALDLAAAAVHLALSGPVEEMPTALAEKLYLASAAMTPTPPVTRPRPAAKPRERAERRKAPAWVAWSGWGVAASFAAVALIALARPPKVEVKTEFVDREVIKEVPKIEIVKEIVYQEPPPSFVKAEVDKDPKAVRFAEAKGKVTANVVWSESQNQGYLEIRGLELNDPKLAQYQLWVIDKGRPDPKPISAGVFDVKPDGTTLVRVKASLKFGTGDTLFAISQESPAGNPQPTKVVMAIPKKV